MFVSMDQYLKHPRFLPSVKNVWLVAVVSYCGLIFYLSNQTSLPVPMLFSHQDKLLHATAYAVMAFFVVNYLKYRCSTLKMTLLLSFVFCAFYGASDEWHQSFVEGRQADSLDWLADCFGAALLLFGYKVLGDRYTIIRFSFKE